MSRLLQRTLVVFGLLGAAACSDLLQPSEQAPFAQFEIIDGSNTGVDGFHFLGQLAPSTAPPSFTGVFDGTRTPTARICQLVNEACLTPDLVTFPVDSIEVDTQEEQYKAKWRKKDYDLEVGEVYRVIVELDGFALGHADLVITKGNDGREVQNTLTGESVTTNANGAIPIHFRIEAGLTIETNLVARYPFDGNAMDATGNGHDGIVEGASLAPDRFGAPQSAYSFDGVNDRIRVPHDADLNFEGDFTMAAWVLTDALTTANNFVVAKGVNTSVHEYGLYFQNGENEASMSVNNAAASNLNLSSSFAVPTDEWTHVAIVAESDTLKLYINGEGIAERVYTYASTTEDMFFGFLSPQYYFGSIDEIYLFDRALAAGEVRELCDLPSVCQIGDLVAHYPFGGGFGDASTNGLDGTPFGGIGFGPDRFGNASSALSLDGTDDWVSIGNDPRLNLGGEYSISVWVISNSTPIGDNEILGKGVGLGTSGYPGTHEYAMWTTNGQNWPRGSANTVFTRAGWDQPISHTEWTHLVFTMDAGTGRLYVNGQLETVSSIPTATHTSASLSIGQFAGLFYTGLIDDVRIYDRTLSAAEAVALCDVSAICG